MSDEAYGQDQGEKDEDVEAHGLYEPVSKPVDEPISATEEPPDVEGHAFDRPISKPID